MKEKTILKRMCAMFLAALMIITSVNLEPLMVRAEETGGICGKNGQGNVVWKYDSSTQTVTISGHGEMQDYENVYNGETRAPWLSNTISHIVVEEGVTSIGNYAFKETACEDVSLSDGLKRIGEGAFSECRSLTSLEIPATVTNLEYEAFYWTGLVSV